MKINKKIIITALLILTMLCIISTASAEDTLNQNLTVSNTDKVVLEEDSSHNVLEVSDNEEKLNSEHEVSNYDELKTAVSNAGDGDTIILKDGTYSFPDSSGTIALSSSNNAKSLTFKGQTKNGVTITSPGNYAIFTAVDNYNLKLENINFNTISVSGSAIVFSNGNGNLDIINCAFSDCKTGWGIVRTGTSFNGQFNLNGVTFTNCEHTQNKAAGVILFLAGKETFNIEHVVIDSAKITVSTNMVQSKGVIYIPNSNAIVKMNDVTIKNSDNIKTSLIYCSGNTTIKNSFLVNNNIAGTKLFHNVGNLTIEQTIISDNGLTGTSNLFYNAGSTSSTANVILNYNNIANNTATNIYGVSNGKNSVVANYNYWGNNFDDANTIKTVTNIDQTSWANKNGDNFVDQNGDDLTESIPTLSATSAAGDIYVSLTGDDTKDGSSPDNAVQSIKHAIELTDNGCTIYVIAGDYIIDEILTISKDLTIKCESGFAAIKCTSTKLFDNSASLSLENIRFKSDENNEVIINNNGGTLAVEKCIFEVNGADASAIHVDGGNVNIENSVLLNPTGYALTVSSTPSTVTANNNWWGKNDSANTNASVSSWIVMNAYTDLERINPGDKVNIIVSFNETNDGSEYTGTLPEFNITVSANNLNTDVSVKSNKASVSYSVNEDDEATVTSGKESIKLPLKLYDAPDIIYVDAEKGSDTNDGDEANPVQSIAKAIELAKKGKIIILEGTYTIDNTLTVNNDLDIAGEGTVIIDGNSKSILSNAANLNITNVQFTNGGNNAAVLRNEGNMTLINCEFYNNKFTGSGNSIIRNNKNSKLTIDKSKFHDNVAGYGNINNNGVLIINNTEFYDNDMSEVSVPYGFVLYNVGGNALIENTNIHDNKGKKAAIYTKDDGFGVNNVLGKLNIINVTFDSNTAIDTGSGAIFSENSNTTIFNSRFINNVAKQGTGTTTGRGGAIYVYGENVTVANSVFMNNKADNEGKDIYVYSGELNIADSVLINNNGYSIEKSDSAVVDANNNWWGANTPNTPISIDKYIVMTVSSNDSDIQTGDEITITVTFTKTNDGEAYTGDLPEVFNVTFTAANLNEVKTVKDKKAEVTYIVDNADKVITITSNNAEDSLKINRILDIIYVSNDGNDDNDGDRESPVASLKKAVELAVKGQIIILEGNYQTDDMGIISNDLNITGEGKVIINANNNNRILYVGQDAKIVLKNLIMINGYTTDEESGALLGNNGDLTLINCTLSDSTSGKNGGAIFNAYTLTVINSTFENNKANENGGAIFTQNSGVGVPTITVSNSTFKSNSAKGKSNYGGGAIYIQQANDVLIENSIFEENTCTEYGGGAVEIAQTNVAAVDNCTFIKNSANSQNDKTRSDFGGGAVSFKGVYSDAKETLTITNSLFLDNTVNECGGGAVFAMYSTVDIHNSVLINNGDKNGVSVYGRDADVAPAKITANDNWWGVNDNPKSSINRGTLNRWAILTISNASEIKEGESVKLTVSINQYTTGSENATLTNPIKVERPVTIHTNNGDITGVLVNGEFTTDYTVPTGLKIISAIVDGETQILTVITTPTTLEIENITGLMGDRLSYTIKVNSDDGTVKTGNVELYFDEDLIATIPVNDGLATGNIIINKKTGVYTITAKYIDPTKEFADNTETAKLNVTGIDNIVTPDNFAKFFDGNILKSDLPFEELFFEGTFEDLGILTIDKSVKLTGKNALFKQTVFQLNADNIELNNVTIELTKSFEDNDGAAVYIGGNNITVSNNNITYNAPDDIQSYAIESDKADNVKIINNNIKYTADSVGGVKTIGINVYKSNNLVFENNNLDLTIPSVAIHYNADFTSNVYSEGMYVEKSKNISIAKNNVSIKYNSIGAGYDTIYGVHVTGSDDGKIIENNIELNGHSYAYGVVIDGKNFEISKNTIKSVSDNYYASGLKIDDDSKGTIESNTIIANASNITYALYAESWGEGSELIVKNNNVTATSNTAYGATFTAKTADISGNNIVANGNYTIALGVKNADSNITNNKISSNGNNIGKSVDDYPIINPIETLGIYSEKANVNIEGNDISSTGDKSILLKNSTGNIKNNELTAKSVKGDSTVKAVDSNVTIQNPDKPATNPVIKITGKNNAKIDYGTGFKVRVTIDGKSIGAGKQVTLKIAGKTLKAKTDKNGYVTFNLAVKPKAYTVTVTYNKISQKYKLTVKNIIKAKNVKVKKSAKKLKIKVTLKAAKKPVKSKKVILKIKGKKITAKTNKKGVATFKVKKNILKKLKAGKKYKFTVTYGKDTVKKTLKVKK